jgi:hypothetical protein
MAKHPGTYQLDGGTQKQVSRLADLPFVGVASEVSQEMTAAD